MGNFRVGNALGEERQVGNVGVGDVWVRIVRVGIVLEQLISLI